jgi:hypothetical protein
LIPNPAIYDASVGAGPMGPLVLRDSIMRFAVGETYEGDFPGGARRALVVDIEPAPEFLTGR